MSFEESILTIVGLFLVYAVEDNLGLIHESINHFESNKALFHL